MRSFMVFIGVALSLWPTNVVAEPTREAVQLPIYFEPNQGQFDAPVAVAARTRAYIALFRPDRIDIAVPNRAGHASLEFIDGVWVTPVPVSPLGGRVNYLRGRPSSWRTNIPTFARVRYREVYPGIDVEFYATNGRLEFDFILAPGADVRRIAMAVRGDTPPRLTASGDLEVPLGTGVLTQHRAVAYQEHNGTRQPVDVRYRLDKRGHVRLDVRSYDRRRPLVVDPVLAYSSAFADSVEDIAVDSNGHLYVSGDTINASFPTTPGAYDRTHDNPDTRSDLFVAKLNAAGTAFVYSTFIGGSGPERARAIAVDASGNAYLTGDTSSPDFPTTPGAWRRTCDNAAGCGNEAFAVKLNATGSALVYGTLIGGSDHDGGIGVAVDASGNAVVVGSTRSPDFPVTPGAYQQSRGADRFRSDAFVVKLNAAASAPVYATYFAGRLEEALLRVKIDAGGNAVAVGGTESSDILVVAPFQPNLAGTSDAVIAKFSPTGTPIFVTYLGGPGRDGAQDVAVDASGNIYVTGLTEGASLGTTAQIGPLGGWDTYVVKIAPSGSSRIWGVVAGGSGGDFGLGIALDASNRAHITGSSASVNFPVTADAIQPQLRGEQDALYATVNAAGTGLVYATYVGGSRQDFGTERGNAIAFQNGRAWLGGATHNTDFPQINSSGAIGKPGDPGWIARFDWETPVVNDPRELVLYAADAENIEGAWRLVNDVSAAAGKRIHHPNAGAARLAAPLANPTHSFELAFTAQAGVAYRLWVRGKADANNWANDSVFVQFSGSIDQAGSPIWRIGTTSATTVTIENCTSCGLSGWGWNDNGFSGFGPVVRFAASGPQRLRIQTREDGLSIDQVVLSAARYMSASPGNAKNDTTILRPSDGSGDGPPPPPPADSCTAGEIVLHAVDATVHGGWAKVADTTAASATRAVDANAGAPRVAAPLAAPTDYIELTFQAEANVDHRLWIRGKAASNNWANDSVYVQFSDSITASGSPTWRIGSTSGTRYQLEECVNCGVSDWGWNDNEFGGTSLGTPVRFATSGTHTIRIQTREDGLSIDQIVLSKAKYFSTAPGPLKNDTTRLDKCARPAASTTP
jgi:hypothetical protein